MTWGRLTLCLAAVLLALTEVRAAPLDVDGCARLKTEQATLEQAGVRGNMAKGPQWAKANLAPEKLEQIRRLLEVEGQFLFRCSGRTLVQLPPEPEGDPAATTSDTNDEGKETPAPTAKVSAPPAVAKQSTDVVKKAPAAAAKAPMAAAPAEKLTGGQPKQESEHKKAPAVVKAPAPAAPAKKGDGTQPPPAKAATVKPKPKPKANDALKAPPADPSADPFAAQVTPAAKK